MADVLPFNTFELSGKGLFARPLLLNTKIPAFRADILSIDYDVFNITDVSGPVSGTLSVAGVMYTALQPWDKDDEGYSFWWPAQGTLWPIANKRYRIRITFNIIPNHANTQLAGKSFRIAFEARTKSSSG